MSVRFARSMPEPLSHTQIVRQVGGILKKLIGTELPVYKKMQDFIIKNGGKMIRLCLHYYTAKMLNYKGSEWKHIGAVGELIHSASLLHDDVIDDSSERRGALSTNSLHGNKVAILAGDYLCSSGMAHIALLSDSVRILPIFARSVRMLAIGELLQMKWKEKMTEKTYEEIITAKTACLFGCMTESAFVLADPKGDQKKQEVYKKYGERMGRMFQIRDDFLDYFGNSKIIGKKKMLDFERGLITRPILILRKNLDRKNNKLLSELFKKEELRHSSQGKDLIFSLFEKTNLHRNLSLEIEEQIHALMKFIRSHPDSIFGEKMIHQLRGLLVS